MMQDKNILWRDTAIPSEVSSEIRDNYFKDTGHFGSDEEILKFYSPTRGDGSSTSYYELPKEATELKHLIKHKKMEHGIGEAFCALYRLNDNGEYLRNLKKVKYYIDSEIEYTEGLK